MSSHQRVYVLMAPMHYTNMVFVWQRWELLESAIWTQVALKWFESWLETRPQKTSGSTLTWDLGLVKKSLFIYSLIFFWYRQKGRENSNVIPSLIIARNIMHLVVFACHTCSETDKRILSLQFFSQIILNIFETASTSRKQFVQTVD